jgi:hypothetical protein
MGCISSFEEREDHEYIHRKHVITSNRFQDNASLGHLQYLKNLDYASGSIIKSPKIETPTHVLSNLSSIQQYTLSDTINSIEVDRSHFSSSLFLLGAFIVRFFFRITYYSLRFRGWWVWNRSAGR